MKVNPCRDNVLVKLEIVEEKSEGGIIMNSLKDLKREQNGQFQGEIIALGPLSFYEWEGLGNSPEERAKASGIKIGDMAIFHRYDGEDPGVKGYENHRLIPSNLIIGTVES